MIRSFILGIGILVAVGCSTPDVRQTLVAATAARSGDGVVVLEQDGQDEFRFPRCVRKTVQAAARALRVIPPQDVRDALFPWLEPSTAPRGQEAMDSLLARPAIRRRMADLGIRYVVIVTGSTLNEDIKGHIIPSYAGLLGVAWWRRQTTMSITVWDLKESVSGAVSTHVAGRSVVPAFVLPIPFIAPTESSACSSVGKPLADFFNGRRE